MHTIFCRTLTRSTNISFASKQLHLVLNLFWESSSFSTASISYVLKLAVPYEHSCSLFTRTWTLSKMSVEVGKFFVIVDRPQTTSISYPWQQRSRSKTATISVRYVTVHWLWEIPVWPRVHIFSTRNVYRRCSMQHRIAPYAPDRSSLPETISILLLLCNTSIKNRTIAVLIWISFVNITVI